MPHLGNQTIARKSYTLWGGCVVDWVPFLGRQEVLNRGVSVGRKHVYSILG